MIRIAFLLAMLASWAGASAQTFYEIDWEADLRYTALVMYYDDDMIDVRVRFNDENDIYHVAHYTCLGHLETDEETGERFYFFDGQDAEIVYHSEPSDLEYYADNFLFTNLSDQFEYQNLFTIDNYDLESDDFEAGMHECTFERLDPRDFTEQFVYNYFEEHEPEYDLFLALAHEYHPVNDDPQDDPGNDPGQDDPVNDPVNNNPPPPPPPPPTPANSTMHLVFAADVQDRSIGSSTAQDMADITTTFTKISRELGMKIKVHKLKDHDFNREKIISSLNGVNAGANDVLVYYYSGHGYNDTEYTSQFPTMALDGSDLNLEDLYKSIKAKNARLTLVIGDLCNSLPENRVAVGVMNLLPFRSGYLFDENKLRKMFLDSQGFVLSTSSQKGEWSYCMNKPDGTMGGGHFTHAFIESLIQETSKVSVTKAEWSSVFDRAYTKAQHNTKEITNQNGKPGQSGFNRLELR